MIRWSPEDFFYVEECMPQEKIQKEKFGEEPWKERKITCYLGKRFTCKKCGFTFGQQFYGYSYGPGQEPEKVANREMANHLSMFHKAEMC